MEQNKENSSQVDVALLLKVLKANIILILAVAVICAAGLGAFKYFTHTPMYSSDVSFYISGLAMSSSTGEVVVHPGQASTARDLTEAYARIISSDALASRVEEKLKDTDYAMSSRDILAITKVEYDNQIITVSVTHRDADTAYYVAKAIEENVPGILNFYSGIQNDPEKPEQNVAKVTDGAVLDTVPTGSGAVNFAVIGFLLGAIVIYMIAFLRSVLDNFIYTEDDIKANFDVPVIGQIPIWNSVDDNSKRKIMGKGAVARYEFQRDYTEKILAKDTPFAISEAFKLLRTNMRYTTKGERCAVYAVTSAYAYAGKSLVATNVAVSFAQLGEKVLMIDGDLRAPVQQKIFGLDPKATGLSELLAGVCEQESEVSQKIQSHPNLTVITSGRIPPNPAELLSSQKMKDLIEHAKKNYDVVIIDLPPVCEVVDAGVISDLVTGYVMVVRAAYSDRRMVKMSVEMMNGLGANIAGFVLNSVDIKSSDYYKNKYYYGRHVKGQYDSCNDLSTSCICDYADDTARGAEDSAESSK